MVEGTEGAPSSKTEGNEAMWASEWSAWVYVKHYIDMVDDKVHYAYLMLINDILCS